MAAQITHFLGSSFGTVDGDDPVRRWLLMFRGTTRLMTNRSFTQTDMEAGPEATTVAVKDDRRRRKARTHKQL